MAEVSLEQITKVYPTGVRAIQELTLAAHDGELLIVMGQSGCGKTTTLRLIAGLEKPTHGHVHIDGKIADGWPIHQRDLAMVFQKPALYPHLTVRQNLIFGLRFRRRDAGKAPANIDEVSSMLHVDDVLDRFPRQLSGGQQQRVALGRAILRKPRAFLLDEPLSNLDAKLRTEMRRELHLLHRRLRATMIYVTHDQAEALSLGDRVAILDGGVLQQVDTPTELHQRPANRSVAACVGGSGMNFLNGAMSGDGAPLQFVAAGCMLAVPPRTAHGWTAFRGRPLTLGVRTENVLVGELARRAQMDGQGELSRLNLEVLLTEFLGDHPLLVLRRESWTLTAKLDVNGTPSGFVKEGETIEVAVDMAKVHLFDGTTGAALSHPGSG